MRELTPEQQERYDRLKAGKPSGKLNITPAQQERYDRIKAETALENDTFQMETMIGNVPGDAWEAMKDFGYAVNPMNWWEINKGLGATLAGSVQKLIPGEQGMEPHAERFIKGVTDLADPETWEDRPVRSLLNVVPMGKAAGMAGMGIKKGVRGAMRGGANMTMDPVKLYRKSLDPKQAKSPGFAETNLEHGIMPMSKKKWTKKTKKMNDAQRKSLADGDIEAARQQISDAEDLVYAPLRKSPGLLKDALVKGVAGQAAGYVLPIPGAAPTLTMAGVTHAVAKNPVVQARTAMFLKKMRELPKAKQGRLMDILSTPVAPNLIQNAGEMQRPE